MSEGARHGRPRRVPSVAELRPIAQGSKTAADRRWAYRVFRVVSIYVTWALLHTRITPNQVTVLSLVIAAAGLFMVALPGAGLAVAGCVLLLAYHLLDRVDGELARYQARYSLLGVYLDNAGHYLTAGGLLVAASFRASESSTDPRVVLLVGTVGAVASIMARTEKHAPFHLFAQYVMESPGLIETVRQDGGALTKEALDRARAEHGETTRSPLAVLGDLILTLSWFPISVLILMAGFITEAAGVEGSDIVALYTVVGLQVLAYAGVELANLSGNLGSESRRLMRRVGQIHDGEEKREDG